MARQLQSEGPLTLPLEDPRVQVYLAKLLYPNEPKPMEKWLMGDEETKTPPLSSPYRAYIDQQKTLGVQREIDISDTVELSALLEKVRDCAADTLH